MNPQVRTGLTHAGTALGGFIAAIAFMSSHGVDLYAVWDQLNVVVASVTKLLALVTPLATGAYGVYKATTSQKSLDIAAAGGVVILPDQKLANSISSPNVMGPQDATVVKPS